MTILQIMKLFKKTNKCTMEVKRLRLLALEIFKLSAKTVQLLLRTI